MQLVVVYYIMTADWSTGKFFSGQCAYKKYKTAMSRNANPGYNRSVHVILLHGMVIRMKNRDKRLKRKRDMIKDYIKSRLKNLKPKANKSPVSNHQTNKP